MRSTTGATTPSSKLQPFYDPASRRERADLEHNPDGFPLLALMLNRSVNIFNGARINVLMAEMFVSQLLANSKTASDATDAPSLVDVDSILFCRRDLSCRCRTTPLPVTMQLTS